VKIFIEKEKGRLLKNTEATPLFLLFSFPSLLHEKKEGGGKGARLLVTETRRTREKGSNSSTETMCEECLPLSHFYHNKRTREWQGDTVVQAGSVVMSFRFFFFVVVVILYG
jgi:hypothetical protein